MEARLVASLSMFNFLREFVAIDAHSDGRIELHIQVQPIGIHASMLVSWPKHSEVLFFEMFKGINFLI